MKALVAGWFSFEEMGATAGDLLVRDTACEWLEKAGYSYDVAHAHPFAGGVDWQLVDPKQYSHLIFACGPFSNYSPLTELFERFSESCLIGLNLTMREPLSKTTNPFDVLYERNSSAMHRPDVVFITRQPKVPVVGLILVIPQEEYKERALHNLANAAIHRLIDSREMAVVTIDTRLDDNDTNLRTPAEIESLIAKMDIVLTTRLHGTVFAIKNGVPAVVVDAIAGGDKVSQHARAIGWSQVFIADALTDGDLQKAYDYCLSETARKETQECYAGAVKQIEQLRDEFIARFLQDKQYP